MKKHRFPKIIRRRYLIPIFCLLALFGFMPFAASAQSTEQNLPTPITAAEIGGRIAARDIGDARLTGYFYTFDGKQGDVFVNVLTTNFNGDIDIFTAGDLRPLAKITVYADSPTNETGRVIYLRQPVKLILRIEGRSPNDDAATFQIKFAGSFVASTAAAAADSPPEVKATNNPTDVRVNSVGTLIEVKPNPTPAAPPAVVAQTEKPVKIRKPKASARQKTPSTEETAKPALEQTAVVETTKPAAPETIQETPPIISETTPPVQETPVVENPVPVPTESEPKKSEIAEAVSPPSVAPTETIAEKPTETAPPFELENTAPTETAAPPAAVAKAESAAKKSREKKRINGIQPVPAAALENINLVILFKDGSKIERPMSEVFKFSVDKGILTVIAKDGAIGRYSILDVEKITVQ